MKVSLRRKITLAFVAYVLLGGSIWYANYYKHHLVNEKLQVVEGTENLFNTILEARRYEKNYFLYLERRSLEDALAYAGQAQGILTEIIQKYGDHTLPKNLTEGLGGLRKYKRVLNTLLDFYQKGGSLEMSEHFVKDFSRLQQETRELGKTITGNMEQMVSEERVTIKGLIRESRMYHFLALGGILLLSISAVLFLVLNVNRPLKVIEDAIHKIAVGDYRNIPRLSTGDEFESLVSSLNNMIKELNKRSEQLLQSRKLASLGTLTSGVAHELNNPLNNISTSLQILLEELGEGDLEYQRGLLTETEKQVERARDIVRALLEFSRERSFSLKRVHFKPLVDDTIKLIKGELPAKVALQVDVPDEIQGDMDPRRIQQVLLNLILNGVQAMEEGGTLKIKACDQEGKDEFCFQVQDTGKGIPEKDLPKIFDPFFTTKDARREPEAGPSAYHGIIAQQGSGLGLSICHSIVEHHGGRMEVESQEGEGTTFTIHLPLLREQGGTV